MGVSVGLATSMSLMMALAVSGEPVSGPQLEAPPPAESAPPVSTSPPVSAPPAAAEAPSAAPPSEAVPPEAATPPAAIVFPSTTTSTTVVVTRVQHRPAPPPPIPEIECGGGDDEPGARGFVGFSSRLTSVNANPSVLMGARSGFTFGDRFTVGGAFYSLTARYADPITGPRGQPLGLRMTYGGVLLGYRAYSGRVVKLGLETLAGAGAGCVSRGTRTVGRAECIEKVGLITVEPGLELGFVVTDWLKLGLAGGFRFVTREAWRAPNDFTLSGPYLGLNIDVGWFRDPSF